MVEKNKAVQAQILWNCRLESRGMYWWKECSLSLVIININTNTNTNINTNTNLVEGVLLELGDQVLADSEEEKAVAEGERVGSASCDSDPHLRIHIFPF